MGLQDFFFGKSSKQNKTNEDDQNNSEANTIGAIQDQSQIVTDDGLSQNAQTIEVAVNDPADQPADSQTPKDLKLTISDKNTVDLPVGTSLENLKIDGDDLILIQADGSKVIIVDGAHNVPTFIIDGVQIPLEAVKLAFASNDINLAEGEDGSLGVVSSNSSGGDFNQPVGDIGDGLDLTSLLPPTELAFPARGNEELREQNLAPIITPDSFNLDVRVSEEGLTNANPDEAGVTDTTNSLVATAKINALDPNGDPLSFTLSTAAVITSNGVPIVWGGVGTATLTGFLGDPASGIEAVTITISSDGLITFTLSAPVDHNGINVEDELSFPVIVSVSDGQLTSTVSVNFTIEDDSPIVLEGKVIKKVDEDDINNFDNHHNYDKDGIEGSTGTKPNDGDFWDGSLTGDPASNDKGPAVVAGSVAGVVSMGADQPGSFSFVDEATAVQNFLDLGLSSKGGDLSYQLVDNGSGTFTLIAFVNVGDIGQVFNPEYGDRLVFEFTLDSNGDFSFKLYDQMDHDRPDHGADQNFDLQDGTNGDVYGLDFGQIIKATDSDGDYVTLGDHVLIMIRDDVPEQIQHKKVWGVVEEEHLHNGQSQGNEDFDGPFGLDKDHPDYGNGIHLHHTTTVVSGTGSNSLASLIKSGTDEDVTFKFISEVFARAKLEHMDLSSKGSDLSYDIIGNKLIGFVNAEGPHGQHYNHGSDTKVFELTLDSDGDWQFEIFDQFDHSSGNGENLLKIDFSDLIKVTDFDGDTIILDGGTFQIKVIDDVPIALHGQKIIATVDEDDINNYQSVGTSPNDGSGDGSVTGNPGSNIYGPAVATGMLGNLVKVGADEDISFTFVSEHRVRDYLESLDLQSKGQELSYDLQGNVLYAFDNAGPSQGEHFDPQYGDRLVFKLTIGADGSYTLELHDQLDHDAPYDDYGDAPVLPGDSYPIADQNFDLQEDISGDVTHINFGKIIKATDFDGDSVLLDGHFLANFRDDVPQVYAKMGHHNVAIDETAYRQQDDTYSHSVKQLFDNEVQYKGQDPDMHNQYAQSGGSVVSAVIKPGADETATVKWSLILSEGNGTNSGIETTDGRDIFLFYENGVIVGRYDKPHDGDGDVNGPHSSDPDPAAFAIHIDDNGVISVAQFVSLNHPDNSSHDEFITFPHDVLLAKITVEDFDGDKAIDTVDLTDGIKFYDDGPSISATSVAVDEDGLLSGNGNDAAAGDHSAIAATANGDLTINFGADGPDGTSEIVINLASVSTNDPDVGVITTLTSNGDDVTTSWDDNTNTLTGTAGSIPVFTLVVNGDGTYDFNLLANLDHPSTDQDGNNDGNPQIAYEDDIILNFTATVKDGDGDTAQVNFSVTVDDDGPVANNDSDMLVEGEATTGNVISGEGTTDGLNGSGSDDAGADNPGTITGIKHNGHDYNVGENFETELGGTFQINEDGSYSYEAADSLIHKQVDLKVTYNGESAGYDNTMGYVLLDQNGLPVDGQIMFASSDDTPIGTMFQKSLTGITEFQVAFFLIPDGNGNNAGTGYVDGAGITFIQNDNGQWQAHLDGAPLTGDGAPAFFFLPEGDATSLNPSTIEYVDSLNNGFGWEDIAGGGDKDFNDFLFDFEITHSEPDHQSLR